LKIVKERLIVAVARKGKRKMENIDYKIILNPTSLIVFIKYNKKTGILSIYSCKNN